MHDECVSLNTFYIAFSVLTKECLQLNQVSRKIYQRASINNSSFHSKSHLIKEVLCEKIVNMTG